MKRRIDTVQVYANPQIPAKCLSFLKGSLLSQGAHISWEPLSALVVILCKSLYFGMWWPSLMLHFGFQNGKLVEGGTICFYTVSSPQFPELSLKCKVIIFYKWPEKVLYEYGIVASAALNCFPYGHLLVASLFMHICFLLGFTEFSNH